MGQNDQPSPRSIQANDAIWGKFKILAAARKEKLSITLAYLVAAEWERLNSNNPDDRGGRIIWPISQSKNPKKKRRRQTP